MPAGKLEGNSAVTEGTPGGLEDPSDNGYLIIDNG